MSYADQVNALYQSQLGRSGDAGGLAYFADLLARGATLDDVAASMRASSEYQARAAVQASAYSGIADSHTAASVAAGGGSFALPNGQLAIPVYGQGGYDPSVGDYVAGPVTSYYVYDKAAGEGGTTRYANAPITVTDTAGRVTGTTNFASDIGKTDWIETVGQIGVAIGAALVGGNALGLISAPGGGAAAAAAGGSGTAGPVIGKAALDGTTAFGANSVAGAYELAGTVASTTGAAGTTVANAASTAGTGTLSSVASTVAGGVKAVAGIAGAVLTAAGVTGAGTPNNVAPGARVPMAATPAATQQNNIIWGVLGAAVLGYLAFKG